MIILLTVLIALLAVDTMVSTAVLLVVCKRAGYKVPLLPDPQKPEYFA